MKAFIIVIIVSAIIGGFVGGELTDRTFLLTGAVTVLRQRWIKRTTSVIRWT